LLFNLSPARVVFLSCAAIGTVTASAALVASGRSDPKFAVLFFGVWMILGLFLGGIACVADSLASWRS